MEDVFHEEKRPFYISRSCIVCRVVGVVCSVRAAQVTGLHRRLCLGPTALLGTVCLDLSEVTPSTLSCLRRYADGVHLECLISEYNMADEYLGLHFTSECGNFVSRFEDAIIMLTKYFYVNFFPDIATR